MGVSHLYTHTLLSNIICFSPPPLHSYHKHFLKQLDCYFFKKKKGIFKKVEIVYVFMFIYRRWICNISISETELQYDPEHS